ncbi:stage V sporulation protein AA [Pasteuria penetrans]|uniref:stage V sporulation protein AA n=1 Tax=Pasteuria penetrans TaxID=86005 RepID=UPI000FA23C68|nr:stage V sporulation protein AA [Pasteuria penetrans]
MANKQKIYLCFRKRVQAPPDAVLMVRDVCLFSTGVGNEEIGSLPLGRVADQVTHSVVEAVDVIKQIHARFPDREVEFLGTSQVLVEGETSATRAPRYLVLAVTWIVVFLGSGLAIMYFHADVGMQEVHQRIHELLTGEITNHPLWLQIPYALGIGLGMFAFFNRSWRKRRDREPSPLEIESFQYQQLLDQYAMNRPHTHKLSKTAADSLYNSP